MEITMSPSDRDDDSWWHHQDELMMQLEEEERIDACNKAVAEYLSQENTHAV